MVASLQQWDRFLSTVSPTSVFQFHKGLKQGDPLSLFLFILIMESLHLSFSKVMDTGLYKGLSINESFTLSHLFYADDVVFVGEWSDSNINNIIHVLQCFFLALGLKINIHKSKLMGIGVSSIEVDNAAKKVGCATFTTPFHYLSVKVGGSMSRKSSWTEVICKLSSRLSKLKLKTLSIAGRLTLIKSVLSAVPLYHMSMFKVPKCVSNKMEALRRNFFNSVEGSGSKVNWVGWNHVLASKEKGGLGVSSFFALNRALLFKWVWRYISQIPSLWTRFITAIHGSRGAVEGTSSSRNSPWLDIIKDLSSLKTKGIDLLGFAKKKVRNGEKTLFWDDLWIGEDVLKSQFPRLFALESQKDISVAEKMYHSSLAFSFRRMPRGGVEEEQINFTNRSATYTKILGMV
ncbi:RNA-directed DNA polymerase, eukaryota [Tanacetum coccineum]|uniref:RNA-directed DNA polymerase, eukaryota n=1 Tax=Tanacetum coccineum TaxID=301880 RepID=A0ABQ4XXH6_9ASTR